MDKEPNKVLRGSFVAGLDEVGMGSLAGPLCIAVVMFSADMEPIKGVTDSKLLSKKKREALAPLIVDAASYVKIGWASPKVIDRCGLAEAWREAASQALSKLPSGVVLIVDGTRTPETELPEGWTGDLRVYPKADLKDWQVGAASIVAKVARDQEMLEASERFGRQYLWHENSGYGSKKHQEAIIKYGATPYHRQTFLKKMQRRLGVVAYPKSVISP